MKILKGCLVAAGEILDEVEVAPADIPSMAASVGALPGLVRAWVQDNQLWIEYKDSPEAAEVIAKVLRRKS